MTWTTFRRRGEVLRAVIDTLDAQQDTREAGRLPMDLAGVRETFGDERTLLGALQLRWHTRLSGRLERALMNQPSDLEDAVVDAWHATADELPGVRTALDRYRTEPVDEAMAAALAVSAAKERVLLAAWAGRGTATTPETAEAGRALEVRVRASYRAHVAA